MYTCNTVRQTKGSCKGVLSTFMINGTAEPTAQVVYKKIIVT